MNYKAHRNYGATTALIVIIVSAIATKSVEISLFCGLITLIFSLFPDLDTHSTPSRYAAWAVLVAMGYFIYFKQEINACLIAGCFIFIKTQKHRGWTHKFWLPSLLLGVGLYCLESIGVYFIAASVGLCTHFACDSISPLKLRNWF
jgi:uncharacterized metal-binding protein